MKTLFIDTHSEKITMILKLEEKIYKEESLSNRSHSEVAIPVLESLLKSADCSIEDIDELVVVNGPGSFTGVRIGVTIAKTISYDAHKPIRTITSLEMYGVSSSSSKFDIVAIEDSKGVYSARVAGGKYEDFRYQKRSEFLDYIAENGYVVLSEKSIDIDKILAYLEDVPHVNAHKVNPIYIKEIDALK